MEDWRPREWRPEDDEPPEWEQDGWGDDAEYGSDDYGDDSYDEAETIVCSECGTDVYEDSPLCPVCGHAMSRSRSPLAGRPNWYVIFGIIGVLVTIYVLALGGM